jgi:hypothetical protein
MLLDTKGVITGLDEVGITGVGAAMGEFPIGPGAGTIGEKRMLGLELG